MPESIHIDNSQGISGKAAAWVAVICLVLGLVGGTWATWSFFRFEPSEEYIAEMATLDAALEVTGDSLRTIERGLAEADEAARRAEDRALALADELTETNAHAQALETRALALAAQAVGARDDPGATPEVIARIEEEARLARLEADDAHEVVCAVCERTVEAQTAAMDSLRATVSDREAETRLLRSENVGLGDALETAREEVLRAEGRIVRRWYHPTVTAGPGCVLIGGPRSCGISVAVGFTFDPLRWIRR